MDDEDQFDMRAYERDAEEKIMEQFGLSERDKDNVRERMVTKKCSKCGETKPVSKFHVTKRTDDGPPVRRADCDVCKNKVVSRGRAESGSDRKYDKARRSNPDFANKIGAKNCIARALKEGRIAKLACEVCSDEKTTAHHESYEREHWLDVQWLCRKHHRARHVDIKKGIALEKTICRLRKIDGPCVCGPNDIQCREDCLVCQTGRCPR